MAMPDPAPAAQWRQPQDCNPYLLEFQENHMRSPLPSAEATPRPGHRLRPWRRGAGLALASAAVAALAAGLSASVASASGPAAPPAMSVTAVRSAAVTTVPLVAGGRVVVTTTAGRQPSYLVRPEGGSRAALSYQVSGDRYIVPAVAVPYLGRELSPSLFDVSALARDGITAGARIPVRLRFAPGARAAAPPGVTLTWVRGETARGYLTAASGRLFAAALARQDGTDTLRGHLTHAGRLFGGLTGMNLAAPGAPAPARPDYPLHTLRLTVTDLADQPANNVSVVLMNTDDIRREQAVVPVAGGVARVAVPAGDYCLFALFTDFTAAGQVTAFRYVVRNDFRVSATAAGTTVAVAERSATSPISVAVPRPAAAKEMETLFYRASAAGGALGTGLTTTPPYLLPLYISPQPAAKVGRLRYLERWSGAAPHGGYWYDTAFASRDIPASEHFVVQPSQVATVREHFFADPAAHRFAVPLWADDPCDLATLCGGHSPATALVTLSSPQVVHMPGNFTLYVRTANGDPWVQYVQTPNYTILVADSHPFTAGHTYSLEWAHGPLAPGLGQHTGPWQCQACTAGRTLSLSFSGLGDSDPGHFTLPIQQLRLFQVPPKASSHFTLYRDGTSLVSSSGTTGAVVHGIPARPSAYRAVLDVSLAGVRGFSQSTRTHTDLTVRYVPGAGAALPAGDVCSGQSAAAPCRILPALTLGYQLATGQDNTSSAAEQVLHLRVGHVSYDGAGSRAPVRSAAVWVSFDGGRSWRRATVTGSGGTYTATWPNPASAQATSPEIKVTASDAIGGSITQTITNAYTIAMTSHDRSPR
jgi:hypothetical protein